MSGEEVEDGLKEEADELILKDEVDAMLEGPETRRWVARLRPYCGVGREEIGYEEEGGGGEPKEEEMR